MQASSEIVIKQPAERIDLARWVSTLSDGDYQACSPGHRAAGIFSEGGTFGSVNVENVGGHLLVQHYLAVFASPERVVMHSRNTRAYVMHLFPATIEGDVDGRCTASGQRQRAAPLRRRDADARAVVGGCNTGIAAALSPLARSGRDAVLREGYCTKDQRRRAQWRGIVADADTRRFPASRGSIVVAQR